MAHPSEWKAEITTGWSLLLTATIACGSGVSSLIYYSFGLFVTPLQQAFQARRRQSDIRTASNQLNLFEF